MNDDPEQAGKLTRTPANQNPWYVLMTLYGEQERFDIPPWGFDYYLNRKNRAVWNAWSGQNMSEEERQAAAELSGVPIEELAAWDIIKSEVTELFEEVLEERNGFDFPCLDLPDPIAVIDLDWVVFSKPLMILRAVFNTTANFKNATFERKVDFICATFRGRAWFEGARFEREADFGSAKFDGDTVFGETTFGETASFTETKFGGKVGLVRATFRGDAVFEGAAFSMGGYFTKAQFGVLQENQKVDFTDCQFNCKTRDLI